MIWHSNLEASRKLRLLYIGRQALEKQQRPYNLQKLKDKYIIRKINLKTQFIMKNWGKGGAKGEQENHLQPTCMNYNM